MRRLRMIAVLSVIRPFARVQGDPTRANSSKGGGIMGEHVLKSGGNEPSIPEPRNHDPSRNMPLKEALQRSGPAPSGTLPAGMAHPLEPPRQPAAKPRQWRGTFEGDEAAVELRSRLAAVRGGSLEP